MLIFAVAKGTNAVNIDLQTQQFEVQGVDDDKKDSEKKS
jgi:hypothetical protein